MSHEIPAMPTPVEAVPFAMRWVQLPDASYHLQWMNPASEWVTVPIVRSLAAGGVPLTGDQKPFTLAIGGWQAEVPQDEAK